MRREIPLLVPIVLYVVFAIFLPVTAPVAINDDWLYARSVEVLLSEGHLRVMDGAIPNTVFQAVWAAPFVLVAGEIFGGARISTVAITLLAGIAVYLACRALRVAPALSALACAAFLFHPLSFVLAYTFMTDPHFAALTAISAAIYIFAIDRYFDGHSSSRWLLILASLAAAAAYLVRQQGLLIIPTLGLFALLRFGFSQWRPMARFLAYSLGPMLVIVPTHLYWKIFIHPPSRWQQIYATDYLNSSLVTNLVFSFFFPVGAYLTLGFLVLSLALPAAFLLPSILKSLSPKRLRWLMSGSILFIFPVMFLYVGTQHRMPAFPVWVSLTGLGAYDLHARPILWPPWLYLVFTLIAMVSALVTTGLFLTIRLPAKRDAATLKVPGVALLSKIAPLAVGGREFLLIFTILHLIGLAATSWGFRALALVGYFTPSQDRYFLPLLPLVIMLCAAIISEWNPRGVLLSAMSLLVTVQAAICFAGVRDHLVYHQNLWQFARETIAGGVNPQDLDAGAAWSGYHLYRPDLVERDYSEVPHFTAEMKNIRSIPTTLPPWWSAMWAPQMTSKYFMSATELTNHRFVRRRYVPAWQSERLRWIYLYERDQTQDMSKEEYRLWEIETLKKVREKESFIR